MRPPRSKTSSTPRRPRRFGQQPDSGRFARLLPPTFSVSSPCRPSCGRSPIWAAGTRWIRNSSTRSPAASRRSTCRPPDDNGDNAASDRTHPGGWRVGAEGSPRREEGKLGGGGGGGGWCVVWVVVLV